MIIFKIFLYIILYWIVFYQIIKSLTIQKVRWRNDKNYFWFIVFVILFVLVNIAFVKDIIIIHL